MPMVVAKRNARERTRVHTVNQAFLVLKQHLPSLRQFTKRVSKLRILNAAINYIEALLKLIQSAESVPQSVISATLAPMAPVRQKKQEPVLRREPHCPPDHSLVDYRPNDVHGHTVFAPQPTFPYVKSILDYPSYLYPPPDSSQMGVNNQLVPMPTYQCF